MPTADLVVHQLGSGSSGNATVVSGAKGALLIDAGFSARDVLARAAQRGVTAQSIHGLLVTHSHTDHCRGVAVLARRLGLPVWASAATLGALPDLRGMERLCELPACAGVEIAGLHVESLPVSHDAPGTVILRVEGRLGIATDLGCADGAVAGFLSGLDGLLLELNHDVQMLAAGNDPPWLKARIRSDLGHLSNDQACELLSRPGFRPPRRALWLCHLSRRNNRPELARRAAALALGRRAAQIVVTDQHRPAVSLEV